MDMYDREIMREKLRGMLRELGVDVPNELPDRWVEVVDDDGTVQKR